MRHGETGLLVGSQQDFVATVDRLLTDHRLRLRLGTAAVGHARRYGWDSTVDSWERLLTEVTGRAADVGPGATELSARRTGG